MISAINKFYNRLSALKIETVLLIFVVISKYILSSLKDVAICESKKYSWTLNAFRAIQKMNSKFLLDQKSWVRKHL